MMVLLIETTLVGGHSGCRKRGSLGGSRACPAAESGECLGDVGIGDLAGRLWMVMRRSGVTVIVSEGPRQSSAVCDLQSKAIFQASPAGDRDWGAPVVKAMCAAGVHRRGSSSHVASRPVSGPEGRPSGTVWADSE